ncbi:M23 family metallopeptidase [Nocardia transvalensis]|uniref:M23 family metallopeptidase n=1 Tax=Nocardia transvalensis TaxID=37333 RepID=UPI00189508D4|nr:M23 family metallopeptidase [Nocardia transvalensis]MBF6330560.1 M23 family metallopeptidase [Nocardia transvalensis]
MTSSFLQHGQSAGRYRPDGESFGNPSYFGEAGSPHFDAWQRPEPVDEWNAQPSWTPEPTEDPWAASPSDTGGWNAWDSHDEPLDQHDDYDSPADDPEPFDIARLGGAWPRSTSRTDGVAGRSNRLGARRSGAHRMPAPPAALKGRAAVVAVAAGAVVAAGQAGMESNGQQHANTADYEAAGQVHEIAAQAAVSTDTAGSQTPQVLNVAPVADVSQFQDILQHGQKFAEELAAQEAAKLRPLFVKFANGTFTSGFGSRWGVQHLGVDVAAPIGTPIYAVEDGTVLDAGPASGFGMWVRLQHDDGTITVYGHIDTATVSVGERVMAGDQIATVGNRGFSTGPHCHFEVWRNGHDKIDPLPWLASRGISLGPERD